VKVLIKLGGTLLDEPAKRADIAQQLAAVAGLCELVVVHGGGKQVTRFLEERGVKSEFVNGLRVSDETVISAVTQVIAGGVNKQLVASVIAAGRSAVGLSGVDGSLTQAEQLSPELQFVGKPISSNGTLLDLLVHAGYLPIVACLAADLEGNIYNVNADQMAVSCAAGWHADKLFFLTDVPGVKDGDGRTLSYLNQTEIRKLISGGVAHGGMQAKLESAIWALESGLSEVVVAPGHAPNICRDLLAGTPCGTRISLLRNPQPAGASH
jgi:acetylglutamate kinase